MPRPPFDPQRAAQALFDADQMGTKKTALEYGVKPTTIHQWRSRLRKGTKAADDTLREVYARLTGGTVPVPTSAPAPPAPATEAARATPRTVLDLICAEMMDTAPVVFGSIRRMAAADKGLAAAKAFQGMVDKLNELSVLSDDEGSA